jgi:Holliday junction resolvase YEN1
MAEFLHRYKAGRPINEVDVAKVHALMIDELRTNASGHLGRRYPARAAELQVKDHLTLFPAFALDAYLRPATSSDDPSQGWPGFGNGEAVFQKRGKARSEGRGDMESFAKACEKFFEWGTKDLVAKKFASESVGLFGSELVTCARERVRLRDPAPSKVKAKLVDQEDIPRNPHITSFFQSTSGSSRSTSRPNKPRKSFQDMPAHVIKIHSSRPDPTNPDLKELRISFTSAAYIKRCHDAMDGHRVDPKDLDESERANLGLVGKDDAGDKVDAPNQKAEVRLWIAEYLVQEAWPELIKAYEEELAAKARPKPKARAVKKGTKDKAGENTAAFKSFFTQPRTQRPPHSQRAMTSESEEEEPLEYRPSASRDSTLTPPPPTSPLPSRERIKRNVRRSPPSSSTASVSSSRPPISSGSGSLSGNDPTPKAMPPRRGPRRSARFSQQAKSNNDIIDLCSSDDDDDLTPPPPPPPATRRPLASTSRTNSSPAPISRIDASPAPNSRPTSKPKPKSKGNGNQSQSLLTLPPIKPISTLVTEPTREREKPKEMKKRKEKSPLYLVTYEDDNVVEIDVRGRWARGESVGLWEDV